MSRARSATATTLHVTAGVLSGTAKAVDTVAKLVRSRPSPAEEVAGTYARRGAASPPPVTERPPAPSPSLAAAPSPARVPATHIEELAEQPAADVIAEVGDLSTDELRQLAEYEGRNRRRKTVLAAIERTAEDFAG